MSQRLVFLKLGGSLITVKNQPHTPRLGVLERVAQEVASARAQDPGLQILLGHGSGSFGHVPGNQYHTRLGVKSAAEWQGFAEVWRQARELNHLVMAALEKAGLPARAYPPSARVIARGGKVSTWNVFSLLNALEDGLLPVIYGDVAFDSGRGGTILSTEELFSYLAYQLLPSQLLFAGLEMGVWADFPTNTSLIAEITPASFPQVEAGLRGSASTDVTGGMLEKVRLTVSLVEAIPGLSAMIYSGETPGNIRSTLLGGAAGTVIHAS